MNPQAGNGHAGVGDDGGSRFVVPRVEGTCTQGDAQRDDDGSSFATDDEASRQRRLKDADEKVPKECKESSSGGGRGWRRKKK